MYLKLGWQQFNNKHNFTPSFSISILLQEVIIDYGSSFVTYGKITETKSSHKDSSFPAEVPLIRLIGVANLNLPVIA